MNLVRPALLLAVLLPPLFAQQNAAPGTDINLYDVGSSTIYGRRGPAYPGGEVGIGFGHSFCNAGTVHVPWATSPTTSGLMTDVHFKIAYLLARESNGRMVQVSTRDSYVKHSRVTYNLGSSNCGTCQSGPTSTFRIGCYDAYSTGFNGNRFNLGPSNEINPWLGSWDPVGSYFDRGDPEVAGAAASDGTQSLTNAQVSAFDAVKNRVTVSESELSQPGMFYGQVHQVCEGEPVANRGNNLLSDRLTFTWSGTAWSTSNVGSPVAGSVLTRWAGATSNLGGNGVEDGRFLVAVKVTGPVAGMWHYEYAVHNIDNHRGGASLRIPVCPTARVTNFGFKDVDNDPLNGWTMNRSGGEVAILAAANNPLDWNCIYNVWFDSDAAPVAGIVSIDQARLGAGALTVDVAAQVPSLLGTEYLGDGCGTPVPAAFANGLPTSPNPTYAIQFQVSPGALVVAAFGLGGANVPLGAGCTFFLDEPQIVFFALAVADGFGAAQHDLPLAAGMSPIDFFCQGFELVASGPFLGSFAASNGLKIRVGGATCP